MHKTILLTAALICWVAYQSTVQAQSKMYTLEDCINIALENNLTVQRGRLDQRSANIDLNQSKICLLYTSPSPRDRQKSRMPSSA